jgi:hypothetical protein
MSSSSQPSEDAAVSAEPANRDGPPRRSRASVLLGLFILGQLAFLFAANFLGMVDQYTRTGFPERIKAPVEQAAPSGGHLWRLNENLYTLAWHWGQVTGQPQSWGLFAPVGMDCAFPALQLRHELPVESAPMLARPAHVLAGQHPAQVATVAVMLQSAAWRAPETERLVRHLSLLGARRPLELAALQQLALLASGAMPSEAELLLSDNEPRNIERYLRIGRFRLRRLEGSVLPYLPVRATREKTLENWRERIESHVRQYGQLIMTYCRFRLDAAGLGNDKAPAQVILVMRRYRIRPPEEAGTQHWTGPEVIPIARWQPRRTGTPDAQPVEWYNPETERFERIAK